MPLNRPSLSEIANRQRMDDVHRENLRQFLAGMGNMVRSSAAATVGQLGDWESFMDMIERGKRGFGLPHPKGSPLPDTNEMAKMFGADINSPSGFVGSIGVPDPKDLAKLAVVGAVIKGRTGGRLVDMYHATNKDFDVPRPSMAGTGEQAHSPGDTMRAVFLTDNPNVADSYLDGIFVDTSTHKTPFRDFGDGMGRTYTDGGRIMPVKVDTSGMTVIDADGAFYDNPQLKTAITKAKRSGAPGVVVRNIKDPGVMTYKTEKSTVAMVFADGRISGAFK